jgi:ABC-2 type transport system permease protein
MTGIEVLRRAAHLSLAEFFDRYPPKLYFISWLPRSVFQLAFFGLLAQFIGGPGYLSFVVVGTVAHATYIGALVLMASFIGSELGTGTIPLLVAAPSHPLLVLVGRNAALLGNAVLTGSVTLALATVVLQLDISPGHLVAAIGVVLLMTISVYGFGLLIGSIALRIPDYRNTISNLSGIALTFLAGVYVPVQALPEAVRAISEVLPVTHGLQVLRHVTLGTPVDVAAALAAEAAIAVVLFALSIVSFSFFLRSARSQGTLDFH